MNRRRGRGAACTVLLLLLTGCSGEGGSEATEIIAPVVDAAADLRCDRLGYPCSWSDVDDATFGEVVDLADRVQAAIDGAEDPRAGIESAVALLTSEDHVIEVLPDTRRYTSLMYRVDGAPPSVAFTELASPLGPPPSSGSSTGDAEAAPMVRAASFRPAGGPLTPKRALVLDPFARSGSGCDDDVPPGECYVTGKGRTEGATVAAIMGAHPQISVEYVHAETSDVDLGALVRSLDQYDLVHLATHGASTCSESVTKWLPDFDEEKPATGTIYGIDIENWDPNKCYSASAIAPTQRDRTVDPGRSRLPTDLPPGLAYGGDVWTATTDFWTGRFSDDAIVYFSHCTSGDGQLATSGSFGAFVGWHGYANADTAQQAGISFWRDMVAGGVEFDLAHEHLADQGLNWTLTNVGDSLDTVGTSVAALVAGGRNLRARDVITTFVGARLSGGSTIHADGTIGDGEDDTVPEVRFVVEGVRDGTEHDTVIEILVDGEPLEDTINVGEKGTVASGGPGWNDFEVIVEDLDLARDLKRGDTDPKEPEEHRWEARAYRNASAYSADEADPVFFAATVRARGELGYFDQFGAIPQAEVVTNELVLDFPSVGGAVEGDFLAVVEAGGGAVTERFEATFNGTYDAEAGLIEGTVEAVTTVQSPTIGAMNLDGGTYRGRVDHAAGTIDLVIEGGGQSIPEQLRYE